LIKDLIELSIVVGPASILAIALADAAIPMTGMVDATLLGLCVAFPEQAWSLAVLASLGSAAGTYALFVAAQKGGDAYFQRYAAVPKAQVLRAWFGKYGLFTIFSAAVLPIIPTPLKVLVVCAGMSRVSASSLTMVMLAARLLRNAILAVFALKMRGNAWPFLKDHGWMLGSVALGVYLVLLVVIYRTDLRARFHARSRHQ
jgi:membrane protein DedA with SNARE-associated domain